MSASVKGKSYNVRISFTEAGEPVIGHVHGFYDVSAECYDIRPVPEGIVLQIAKKLGIDKSSRSLRVTRMAQKAKAANVMNLDFQQELSLSNQELTEIVKKA